MTDTLFDPSTYGEPKPPRSKGRGVTIPTEPHSAGWIVVRHRGGVYPFFHLIQLEDPAFGTVRTLCGLTGSKLSNVGVDYMVRCPSCDIADQLS